MNKNNKHYAVSDVIAANRKIRLVDQWVSGYCDLDKYLAACRGEDHVWDLAERITDDAQASGCDLVLEDVFEELELRWRSSEEEKVPREAGSL